MVRKTKVAVVEHPRGGEGSVEFHHIVSEEELNGHGSMYAMAVLRPHSSVGWHQHVGNTEPFFIFCCGIFVSIPLALTHKLYYYTISFPYVARAEGLFLLYFFICG